MTQQVEIGQYNHLRIVKRVDFGIYLDGGEPFGEILLPKRYLPTKFKIGQELKVFIYHDSEDRIIATTETPLAVVGDIAALKVVAVNKVGAFLDWGLKKDLLVPFNEQKGPMHPGEVRVVKVFLDDKTGRIAASAKLNKFLDKEPPDYGIGEEVEILIYKKTDMGYRVVINHRHWGLLFGHGVYEEFQRGRKTKAYIQHIREDGKIDLSLHKLGYGKVGGISDEIMEMLQTQNGFLPFTDKTSPQIIHNLFGVSKKTFKKALGALYKQELIEIKPNGIELLKHKGR